MGLCFLQAGPPSSIQILDTPITDSVPEGGGMPASVARIRRSDEEWRTSSEPGGVSCDQGEGDRGTGEQPAAARERAGMLAPCWLR